MRRISGLAAALTALLLVGAGCASSSSSDSGSSSGDETGPIIIGDAGAESGWLQLYDDATHKGAELAVEKINADGGVNGRKLELATADSESKKDTNYSAALELVQKGAQFVMATCDYDTGVSAAQAAATENVPTMASCASDPQMGKTGCGPMCFTMATTTNVTGSLMAEFAYDELGAKTAAILTDTSIGYSQSLSDYFVERWTALAGADSIVASETFTNADTSVTGQIAKLKSANPDFIFLPSYLPGQGTAIRQIRAAGIDAPIVVGETLQYGKTVLDAIGDPNLSDVYGTMYGYIDQFGDANEDAIQPVVEAYTEKYGSKPDSSMFLTGYGVVQVYAAAAEACDCTTGEKLAEAIEGLTDFKVADAIDTSYSTDSNSPIGRSMAIYEWVDGTTTFVTRKTPAEIVAPKS
jgi:branched-chain amino acid transport system substrate-binding protein